jgi:hypothetical protein
MVKEFHIAVLDFNNSEVVMYKELLTVDSDQTDSEVVEDFLSEKHSLSDIQFMYSNEQIIINEL